MNQKEKIEASEEKIQETICKSKNAFFMAEQERMLSYHDFCGYSFVSYKKDGGFFNL